MKSLRSSDDPATPSLRTTAPPSTMQGKQTLNFPEALIPAHAIQDKNTP
jgi:hypothetical protein